MPRPDEGLIHAWLDGELPPDEAERVARLVAADAEWAAAAAEARGLIAASSRILSALDAVPGGVLPAGSRAAPRGRSNFVVRPWMRVAAGLVLVVGTSYLMIDRSGVPSVDERAASEPTMAEAAPSVAIGQVAADMPIISAAPSPTASAQPRAPSGTATLPPVPRQPLERAREERAPIAANSTDSMASVAVGAGSDARREATDAVRRLADEREATARRSLAPYAAPPAVPPAAQSAAGAAGVNARAASLADRAAETRASTELRRQAEEPLTAVTVTGASAKAASAVARALDGCWRTATSAGADSLLVSPAIIRGQGDTLVIVAGPPARPASIVRQANELLGTMHDATGRRVTFRATRTECPARSRDPGATPSPR